MDKRVISKIYIVKTIKQGEIIKVCSSWELAKYYRKLLAPKYLEEYDLSLTIDSYPLVHFKTEKVQISEGEYIDVVLENLEALEKLNKIKEVIYD